MPLSKTGYFNKLLSFVDTAFLPLGIYMMLRKLPRWRFSRIDCWLALFLFTCCYSERLNWGVSGALLRLITTLLECLVPYMLGKLSVDSQACGSSWSGAS